MDKNTTKTLMDLISSEVFSRPVSDIVELSEEDLNSLYKISKSHDLSHILASALENTSALKPEFEVTEKFKKSLFTSIYRYEKSKFDLKEICTFFAAEGIDHMPLKGAVIRAHYTKPYLRTSCDLDILVKEEDIERATALLVERLNYKPGKKEQHDISFFTPSGGHIELHFRLIEQGFRNSKILAAIWQSREVKETSPHKFEMTPEMFLFFHIYHTAKHFVHGGCGIKPFIDLWIIKNKIGYDEKKTEALFASEGLLEFYKKALSLSEIWFDGKKQTPVTKDMEDFILGGGVYGNIEQQIAMSQSKKGGKLGHLLSRIFLPYQTMLVYYPSLSKCPALFPVYQIRRWFKILFCGGSRRAMNEIRLNSNLSQVKKNKAKKLLDELGL